MTRDEMLRAAILNEFNKFECINVKAMLKKFRRDWPREFFREQEVENILMEDGFFEDRHGEWKIGKELKMVKTGRMN